MKNFLSENKENITIICISLIAFLAGCLAIGWVLSLVIIGLADLLLIIPTIFKKKNIHKSKEKVPMSKIKRKKTEKTNKKKGRKLKKFLKIMIIIIFILFIAAIIVAGLFWKDIVDNAPKFNPDLLYHQESSIIYDMNGNQKQKLATEKRENVSYDELPEVLINAIIATEDSRFFQHNGFDLPRFLKASIQAALGQDGGGASTLTMQVSKNTYTSREVSIKRKFTDIYMAMFEIEKNYTKQEIMEFYVNYPYLGGGAYGVEQACQNYFGKSAKDINLAEAALIAGLFQSPGGYDPYLYPEKAEKRRNTVLYLMERHGYITSEQKKEASKISVDKLIKPKEDSSYDYVYQSFIDQVLKEIEANTGYDPYTTSMEIYTTMDSEKQEYLYSIMRGENFTWENDVVDAGIAVVDVKTGAITALGGGRKATENAKAFNTATMLNNQIGSTSKPIFDYAVGIEYENWSTYTPFEDEPYQYSDGTPINNWDGQYKGWMTARDALAQSRNIPALKAFQLNKNSNIKTFVTNLGLHPEVASNGILHEAHAIGGYTGESPLDMAAAYAAFANQGIYTKPYSYTKIVLRETGEVIENNISKTKAMSEETAYMMTSMLQSSAQYGLGNQSHINGAVYGAKTGTSNFDTATKSAHNLRYDAVHDLWVTGTSPDYAISVWYGYHDIDPNYTNTVNTIQHRKLFQTVGKAIFKTGSTFTKPENVLEVKVEKGSDPVKLASDKTPNDLVLTELFKKGTEPTEISTKYIQLDNVKNLKSSITDTSLTLTWNAVDKQKDCEEAWGDIVYMIYAVNDGKQELLETTSKTSYTYKINSNSAEKYIVKTAYKNFTGNISSGAEITVQLPISKEIKITLNGSENMKVEVGTTFKDPGYTVKEGNSDVTSKSTVKKTILDSSTGTTVDKINTSKSGTYTVNYSITYNKTTKVLTRNIVVTPKSSNSSTNQDSSSNITTEKDNTTTE